MISDKPSMTKYYVWAAIAGICFVTWSLVPPSSISLNRSCQPAGFRATVSSTFVRDAFWRKQREALDDERYQLLDLVNNGEPQQTPSSGIEGRMDRLSGREQSAADVQERKKALLEKRKQERLERLSWLIACSDAVDQR